MLLGQGVPQKVEPQGLCKDLKEFAKVEITKQTSHSFMPQCFREDIPSVFVHISLKAVNGKTAASHTRCT